MVLRRYTPPTCTLEIQAKDSPLSRWAGQPVLKHLRFELSFDDPRQPEDRRVSIRGNRAQLESLCEAVSTYVQDFLQQSPRPQPVAHQMPVGEPMVAAAAPAQAATILSPPESPHFQTFVPYIQPRGLLSHDLFLGHLATEETGSVVTLSALQLFDLATALDEYNAELVALPPLNRTQWLKNPPLWTRTAAIFLLGVGITAATLKLLNQPSPTVISSAPAPTASPSTPAQVPGSTEVLPVPTTTPTAGVPTPPPLSSVSPTPTGSPSSILLSPAPVGTPTPFNAKSPGVVVVPRNPPGNSSPIFTNLPPIQQRSAPEGRAIFQPPPPSNFPPIPKPPAEQPKQAIRNNLPFDPIPSSGGVTAPRIGQPAPGDSASSSQGTNQSASPNAGGIPPAPPPLPNLPSLASLPAESSAANNSEPSPGTTRGSVAPPAGKRDRAQTSSDRAQEDRLFDTIPQVAQVRNYFQQQWKPPAGLTQSLQYYLRLNPDGSIERIRPLGEASVKYIDRTGMPVPGKPFVSPIEGDRNAHIRVVLGSDGKVETFLEP
ncbi:DUF4335 domain-containing protein [Coleofasciculus sp. H7-2]|uniref:DUF4335 domain-containing protein n=1 Tax=Coleofasciculus sp. H7-2 TaxID=3351545 RepID=UPI00367345F7